MQVLTVGTIWDSNLGVGGLNEPYTSDTLNVANGCYKTSYRIHPATCTAQESSIQISRSLYPCSELIYKKYDGVLDYLKGTIKCKWIVVLK